MRIRFKKVILVLVFFVSAFSVSWGQELPRKSPNAGTAFTLGLTDIEITYGSPALDGRELWGKLIPYDRIWRAGANEATKMRFSTEVIIGNKTLPAGTYTFYVYPRAIGKWDAVFNSVSEQWGAFTYEAEKDVLRLPVEPIRHLDRRERLQYEILDTGIDSGIIRIRWDDLQLDIPIKVNYLEEAMRRVEVAIAEGPKDRLWVAYGRGAEFLLTAQHEPDQALAWINESIRERPRGWNHWVRAEILAWRGDFRGAIAAAETCRQLSADNPDDKFFKLNEFRIETSLRKWKTIGGR